jgi:transcriptional regulator with XRE-family HTH domain
MANERQFYLREWRQFRGMTQEQAAERADISKSVLSRIESHQRSFRSEHLDALAHAYSCEPWELIGRDPNAPDGDIARLWARIRPEDRAQAVRTLESFVRES